MDADLQKIQDQINVLFEQRKQLLEKKTEQYRLTLKNDLSWLKGEQMTFEFGFYSGILYRYVLKFHDVNKVLREAELGFTSMEIFGDSKHCQYNVMVEADKTTGFFDCYKFSTDSAETFCKFVKAACIKIKRCNDMTVFKCILENIGD